MNPWVVLAAFVAWTSGVAYFASEYGAGRAEVACQEERDRAAAAQRELEARHAAAGRNFERERKDDHDKIGGLEDQLAVLSRRRPAACSLDAERLRLWNAANSGAALPGKPADEVRDPVPDAGKP